jgi:hypothetical protein
MPRQILIWIGLFLLVKITGIAAAEENRFTAGLARDLEPVIEACYGEDIRFCTLKAEWAAKQFKMLTDKLFSDPIPKSCELNENPVLLIGDYGLKYYAAIASALSRAIDSRHPDVRAQMLKERKLRNQIISEAEEVLLKSGEHAAKSGCLDIADSYYKKVLSSFPSSASAAARERAQVGLAELRQKSESWSCKLLGRC